VAKKPKPFNDAFQKLRELAAARPPPPRPAPPPAAAPPPPPREGTPDELWAGAVAGVRKIEDEHGTIAPPRPKGAPESFWHPDLEAVDQLRALVSGDAPFDLADGDEFFEGRVAGIDANLVRKLRKGEFAVQGHVDLHGMTREEAKAALEAYVFQARHSGKRCVLVVHGRGLHSKDQVPVLKEAVKRWMSTARFAEHVLAFATARPHDGGAGAVYLLLRRV